MVLPKARWIIRSNTKLREPGYLLPPMYDSRSNTSTSTSRPNLSFALDIQNAADEPPAPAPTTAILGGLGSGGITSWGVSTWKKGRLNGNWKARDDPDSRRETVSTRMMSYLHRQLQGSWRRAASNVVDHVDYYARDDINVSRIYIHGRLLPIHHFGFGGPIWYGEII